MYLRNRIDSDANRVRQFPHRGNQLVDAAGASAAMLIKPNARFFVRHELILKACRDRGEPIKFFEQDDTLDVMSILQSRVDAGAATHELDGNDIVELTKIDVRPKANLAILLYRRSNPDAPAPVFHNRKKRTLREIEKLPDEAESVSAHLFINLVVKNKPFPTYRTIMEEVPGLGRSYMHAVLASALRESQYEYEDERGETKQTYTIPTFHGVPSERIGEALKTGTIRFVELIRPPNVSGLDTDGLVPHPERMKLTVRAKTTKNALSIVKRVQDWLDTKHWRDLRVQVQTADNRSRVVTIAREEDAADVLFVHSEEVETNKPIAQCSDTVNEELIAHAIRIFRSDKNWE